MILETAGTCIASVCLMTTNTTKSQFAILARKNSYRQADQCCEIRSLRERAKLSQAAFARYLNLTSGYVSQLERGAKQPKGPALALLNVIRRKGLRR